MKKIFNFGKKGQSSSSSFKLPSYFSVQSSYRQRYQARSKDLGKIHKAALLGKVEKVEQLLLLEKGTVNELDKRRRTPLHLASANGHADVVSLLIERKCELNLLDDENKTPLMKAIECQREACATILLEHGADPNLRDRNSNTILHYIASSETKFMAEKLMKYKIDIEAKNKEGLTPLMLAIKAKNNDMATILLNNGANANAMDGSKRTALMLAVSVEALGLVTLLLQNNADHTLQDTDGWTAEQYAKLYGYPVYVYHKQIEKQMIQIEKPKEQIEEQEPCTSQIRTSAPSLDKKAQENIVEDSISRCSDSSRSVKSRKNTDDELDFDRKERPKLNLMKAKISGETSSSVSTKVATVLKDNQSDNEKDLTDSFAKSSSQAHCSTHAVVHASPANFSQSSLNKSTLLDILKEYPRDSEEAKENDVFVKNDTDNQIFPNIPSQLQAHNTSEKHAERKATKSTSKRSKEEAKSSWDSERSVENLLEGSSRHLASTNQNINKSISLGPEDLSGKNPNVKPSQCGLPMKDPSTSQESEKVVKPKRKLAFMEKVELSAAENTDGHPEKNPNVKPSQCGLPMKDPSTSQESEKVVKPKRKLAFMEKVDLSAAENTDDHPGKNPNVKPSQCGLPMKDPSTSQESEKVVKPKRKLAFMEKVDLSAAEDTDDHPGKNRNVKPNQCGLPMKDSSTRQELEKSVKSKRKLAFMEKLDLSAAEDTDDHPEKNPNVKPSQCGLPMKDPSTSQESEKVVKPKLKLAFMEKVDLSATEDTDDHPGKNRNVKPSQCGLPMKDPSTSQESEKVVKSKRKLEVMGKVDLSAAENTDDGSNWDSTSTSEIPKSHRSSKILNLQRSDVDKSLLRTLNKLGSTRVAAGSGPEVENPGPQKQCEPLLEKEAQKHHPGKNRNVKPSQCGLPMKDPSTSQESEKVVKTKRKLAFMEKVDLPAAENTDDGSNWDSTSTSEIPKSHRSSKILNLQRSDVDKSLLRTLNKLGSTRVAAGSGPEVENPGPQKQCEPLLEKEAQKHHPGKNRNVKPSQCGLPMKDPSTSQESEKVVKTKRKLAFMEKVDLPAAENTDDGSNWDSTSTSETHKTHRSSKNLNLQRSDVGKSLLRTLNKLGSTRAAAGSGPEVENPGPQKQCEPLLEKEAQTHLMQKPEFKGSSYRNQGSFDKRNQGQCFPESLLEKSERHLKDNSSLGQHKDHLSSNSNEKPIQSTLQTSQEVVKRRKEKPELDTSTWDSTDTYEINDRHKSSMHLKLQRTHACKSLSQSKNQLACTEFLSKKAEVAASGSGSDTSSKVRVEKPVPQEHCKPPIRKEKQEEDLNREMEFKTSLGPSQERFNQDQGKVTLQTTSITEQTIPKNQIKSRCAPFLNQKRISQGLESNIKFHGDDVPLGPQRNWKESCEKICVKKEKIVKSKFRMNQTDIYGETCEKDNIADRPKEKLQKDDFENKSEEELSETSSSSATLIYMNNPLEKKKEEELSETSSSDTLTYMSDPLKKKKKKSPYRVKDFQSIPGQLSNNMRSKKSTSQFKNDSKPKTEYTSKVNEKNVTYVAKNIIKVDSKIDINGIKEDRPFGTEMTYSQHRNISSVEPNSGNLFQSNCPGSHLGGQLIQSDNMKSIIQEEKPEVISPRKCKKKTKHLEPLDENNYYNDYNCTYELSDEMDSLSYWDEVSRMYLDEELGQDIQRYRNELRMLQSKARTWEKEKIQPQKEAEEKKQKHQQKKMETLRRQDGASRERHHRGKDEGNKIPGKEMITFSEEYLAFTQILTRLAKKILNKKNEDKVEMVEDAIDDLTQAHATGSICLQTSEKIVVTTSLSIKHQKKTKLVKTTRVLESLQYTVRETQERRKTQSRLKHECDKEHYRSRLKGEKQNREKPQSEIKIISYKSRAIHQKHQTSKKKNQDYLFIKNRIDTLSKRYSKAKKELRKLLHALKVKTLLIEKRQKQIKQVKDKVKKYRLENHILKEKYKRALLQEELLQEKLNEMQKEIPLPQPFENAQKKGAFIKEVFQNIGMHFRDHSMTVDADIEEQDHVAKERKEQIHIYKKEQAEDEEIIKKLQEKVAESQKETFMFVQTSMEMKRIWKKYQRESELHEYQQRIKREKQYIKDIEDYILKLKHSTSENSGEQTDKNEELWDTTDSHFQHIRHLEEKIEAEFSKNIKLELLYRKLQEEAIALQGLPKDDDNLERRRRGI